jgi:two-component system invasion response regulator UvrY
MKKIKIGLFDEHQMANRGVQDYFKEKRSKFEVVFSSSNNKELYCDLENNAIDLLIFDVCCSDSKGFVMLELLKRKYPSLNLLVYSALEGSMLIENLLSIGVNGYVNKKTDPKMLLTAIDAITERKLFVPEEYKFLISKYRDLNSYLLSDREVGVLKLISQELTSVEISDILCIAVNTVENHRKNIFKKFEVKNVAGMMMTANRLGYVS